ncbi:MAG: Fur family transcriptional regulator [Candidatus Bipolaricaulota bacterium]
MAEEDPQELFLKYLRSEDLNVTESRKRIAEEIFKTSDHFDATQLWSKLHEETNISMSTIYRTIDLMLDAGLLREVDLGTDQSNYEQVFTQEEHGHIICLDCGKVMEFASEEIDKIIDSATSKRGFETEHYRLQVFGHCEDCRD